MNGGHVRVRPVIDESVRRLCLHPYPNHPKGCPNYGQKDGCPPSASILGDVLDLDSPIYAIYVRFYLAGHVGKMRKKHPNWTDRQLRCLLYWQPKVNKFLRQMVAAFLEDHPEMVTEVNPEAAGVNVTKTMARAGIHLEWPPRRFVYKIALAGRQVSHGKIGGNRILHAFG